MAKTLRKPAPPAKRTRADWDEIIRRRESLNADRKRLDRESADIKKQVDELDEQIVAFVEDETEGEKEQKLTLKGFILSIVWQKPAAITVAFKAYARLTKDEKTELAAEIGDKKKLDIHWREAPPEA